MERKQEKQWLTMPGLPIVTISVVALSLATYYMPQMKELLVYDRAAIMSGQLWRLVTGNVVHFSDAHLLWNALVFGCAGTWLEGRSHGRFGSLCFGTALATGMLLFFFEPEMIRYGGLSALCTAIVVSLCLWRISASDGCFRIWISVLALTLGKVVFEYATLKAVFVAAEPGSFVVAPAAHVAGLAAAGVGWVVMKGQKIQHGQEETFIEI